jgi:putative nucleotidyltransferase with HDIG domain
MKLNGNYFLAVVSALLSLFFALNPAGIPQAYILPIAAVLTVFISYNRNWINGIFLALFFSFIYYSARGAGIADLVVNTFALCTIAVLTDLAKLFKKNEKDVVQIFPEEKIFFNKIVNSLMLAHDMLWEIKKGQEINDVRGVFSKNIMNLMEVEHVAVYRSVPDKAGVFRLVFSSGQTGSGFMKEIQEKELNGNFLRNVEVSSLPVLKETHGRCALLVPVRDNGSLMEISVFIREKEFTSTDIYIFEFFAAQIFVILEKHELFMKLKENYEKVIEALAIAIDTKDHETHGHSMATMSYAMRLADKMGLSKQECEKIKYAAMLHDIGKINISSKILNKPSSLTEEEFGIIKKHPVEGVNILNRLHIFDEILPIILYHHEHVDGQGYPSKLKGDDIPLGSRICSIADAYSVMRSDRPYRKALTRDEAVHELKKYSGTQFDSGLVDMFLEIIQTDTDGEERIKIN